MGHVGAEIRRLREERGLNQAQLAVAVGTGPAAISRIENGRQSPNATTLAKIAQALQVETAELFPKAQASLPLEDDKQRRYSEEIGKLLEQAGAKTKYVAMPKDEYVALWQSLRENKAVQEMDNLAQKVSEEARLVRPLLNWEDFEPKSEEHKRLRRLWFEYFNRVAIADLTLGIAAGRLRELGDIFHAAGLEQRVAELRKAA